MRGRGTTIAAVLATTVAALVALAAAPGAPADRGPARAGAAASAAADGLPAPPPVTAPGHRRCGTVPLYGHRFPLEAFGIGCGEARQLVNRHCTTSIKRTWTCDSFREDLPFVVWLPSADVFSPRTKTDAELLRYPCSEAKVTPALFQREPLRPEFPSRRQLLADDVIRCQLLEPGDTIAEVEALLGPPGYDEVEAGHRHWEWILGDERDSIVKIDPELLDLEIAAGKVIAIEMVQGG